MDTTQLEFCDLRSFVVVDGSYVPHYGVQYDESAKKATSWIVSEPDKAFYIRAELTHRIPGQDYGVYIYLDGHRASGFVVRAQESPTVLAKTKRVSHTETQNFVFGTLELSDDDALLEASSGQALGEIRINLYRLGTLIRAFDREYSPAPQAQKVHERAKKGLAHSVKYGETRFDPSNLARKHFQCHDKTLIASHIIRYRPLAMLQANGIVPYVSANNGPNASKSLSPVPGPSAARNSKKRKALRGEDIEPVIDLSNNAEEGIVQNENELKAQLEQSQKKKARLQQRLPNEVKQEERKPNVPPGEIIDLTI